MKKLLALLLAFFTAAVTMAAEEDLGSDFIYSVHNRTNKLIAQRGHAFRAHDDIIYTHILETEWEIRTLRVIPGQVEAAIVSTTKPPCSEQKVYPSMPPCLSTTEYQGYNEDAGNVYIINNRREDDAAEVEVKNLPEGFSISMSTAVPHDGKLLLILQEDATQKRFFAFFDVADGMLATPFYPGALADPTSLIWRGGNLVWQISNGRMFTVFNVYDLEKGEYLRKSASCGAYYSAIVPKGRQLICIKSNNDVDILTPLDEPQIAPDAPAPHSTMIYGIPDQPGDTILCTPGKAFFADKSTIYRSDEKWVYALSISRETHFMQKPVFNASEYTVAQPGHNHIISSRYTGDINLQGGDAFLIPKQHTATPLRVNNLPSGYVIDACAAVPYGDKLALHLTHAAEGKCAFALLNTATATIEGPLHPAPLSRPASLIQHSEHLIWEISQANAWEIPLSAYDLRSNKRVFQDTLDTPAAICIPGDTAAHIDIHDLLNINRNQLPND